MATEIYQLYVDEKGTKPKIPGHLTAFAKTKGLKIRFVDARNIIANPPSVATITSSLNDNRNNISTQNTSNSHSSKKPLSLRKKTKCTDCGRRKKCKLYEDDGSFHCLECWNKHHMVTPKTSTNTKVTKCSIPTPSTPTRSRAKANISPYKIDSVDKLYQIYCKSKGTEPHSVNELLKYAQSINIHATWSEVNKFMKNASNNNKMSSTPNGNLSKQEMKELQKRIDELENANQSIISEKQLLSEQCENMKQLVENKEQELECVVCLEKSRSHVCVPCGHLCICQDCVSLINEQCPLCRKKCDNIIKVFK
eukprot:1032241_1